MNKFIISFIFIFVGQSFAWAQSYQEKMLQTSLPWVIGQRVVGELGVRIKNEKLIEIKAQDYLKIREQIFRPQIVSEQRISGNEEWIKVRDLDFEMTYDPMEVAILTNVPDEQLRPEIYSLDMPVELRYKGMANQRAPFGGAINFQLEKSFGHQKLGGDAFSAYFNSFVNIQGFVLENKTNYFENNDKNKEWFRGDTRLVKDFQKYRIRAEAGDIYPRHLGFMAPRPMGGVMVSRDFTLNPYKVSYPRGGGEFILQTRSHVKTIVNGIVVKDEYLPPGNYNLNDLPLINGINRVQLEVTDELGGKQIYEYNLPTAISLLAEDEWDFSVSSGRPFQDNNNKRKYQDSVSTHIMGLYGINDFFTAGGYAQFEDKFWMVGAETGMSSLVGNFFIGLATSGDEDTSGEATSLTWQWQNLGTSLFSTFTLTGKQEFFTEGFRKQSIIPIEGLKSNTQANITIPIKNLMTLSIGTSKGIYRDSSLNDRTSYDATLSLRLHRRVNLSLYAARTEDQYKTRYDIAYAYLTWTFDGSNNFINAFRDIENESTRLSYVRDNNNRLYSPRIHTNLDESKERYGAEVEANIPTPFAHLMVRGAGMNDRIGTHDNYGRASFGLSSAFVFAYQDNSWGVGLSRPVNNSFVLFETKEELKDQDIGLRSSSVYLEEKTGLMGEIVYGNLLPYQYREVQLDPSRLDDGLSLERERFVVYPEYRSAHKITLGGRGAVTLVGQIVDKKGKPRALKVGKINGESFFTDRSGKIYIQSLPEGSYKLTLEGTLEPLIINVSKNERGLKNIGQLIMD